jgi:hypothetical protein
MGSKNFEEDLRISQTLNHEWEKVFRRIFGQDILIKFQDNKIAQLEFGTDTTIQQKTGRKFSVEFKTKRNSLMPYNSWVLELAHHRYSDIERNNKLSSKEGWLYCSTAEYIVYGTLNEKGDKIIEVCMFSLVPFKDEEFKSEISKLPKRFAYTDVPFIQTTIFALAETEFLRQNAKKFWYWKENCGGNLNDYI